jgi:glycoprotein 6-alpha-L-fucosyltransferase
MNFFFRYLDQAVNGIIQDIHMLANSDYLVCTLSSNVCRLAQELKLARNLGHGGVLERDHVVSLDEEWVLYPVMDKPKYYLALNERNIIGGLKYSKGDIIAVKEVKDKPYHGYNYGNHQEGSFVPSALEELFEVSKYYPAFVNSLSRSSLRSN